MTTPDQTNAEVSDERLRGDPLTNKLPMQDEIETILFRRSLEGTLMGGTLPTAHEIAKLLERRSVTSQASEGAGENLHIIFDGPPSHESGRFVEVENDAGYSVRAGEWVERPDGLWDLVIPHASPSKRVERLETALDTLVRSVRSVLAELKPGQSLHPAGAGKTNILVSDANAAAQALGDRS